MANKVKAIPEGFHSLTSYLIIRDAAKAIDYYKKAFGANELYRLEMPDGKIGHSEIQIGDSRLMLADENPEWGHLSPQSIGGSPVGICLYVENVDEVFKRAVDAGGKVKQGMEVKDQFYGDRTGTLIDPFGHHWSIATHIEDVSPEEMNRRADAMFRQKA